VLHSYVLNSFRVRLREPSQFPALYGRRCSGRWSFSTEPVCTAWNADRAAEQVLRDCRLWPPSTTAAGWAGRPSPDTSPLTSSVLQTSSSTPWGRTGCRLTSGSTTGQIVRILLTYTGGGVASKLQLDRSGVESSKR
jgi:hypothetical protein